MDVLLWRRVLSRRSEYLVVENEHFVVSMGISASCCSKGCFVVAMEVFVVAINALLWDWPLWKGRLIVETGSFCGNRRFIVMATNVLLR